jgi:hypothetical protein
MDRNSTSSHDQVNDRKTVDRVMPYEPAPARPGKEMALAGISGPTHRFDPTLPQPLPGGRLGRVTG